MLHQLKLNGNKLQIKDIVDQLQHCKENLYKSAARRIGILAENEYLDHLIEEKRFEDINGFDSKSLHHISVIEFLYWVPYAIFIIVLFAIGLPIICKIFNCNNDPERRMARCNSSLPDRRAIFFTIFEDRVRSEFKTQSAETMSTIVTAVSHILLPNPERPSILLLLSSNSDDGKNTCGKIARATASAVLSSFQKSSQNIDNATLICSNYASSDEFWKFYEDVSDRMNRYKVVILEEFEKLNGQVATAFCHLADDTYAPFPQSILIVCLDIGNRFNSNHLESHEPVTLAETFLEEKWDGIIDRASMTEIFGRLTGRTVLIEREVPLRRLIASSLPSIKESRYSGPPSSLRRRRQIARSQIQM